MLEDTGIHRGLIGVDQRGIAQPSPALEELTVLTAINIKQSTSRSKKQVERGGQECNALAVSMRSAGRAAAVLWTGTAGTFHRV